MHEDYRNLALEALREAFPCWRRPAWRTAPEQGRAWMKGRGEWQQSRSRRRTRSHRDHRPSGRDRNRVSEIYGTRVALDARDGVTIPAQYFSNQIWSQIPRTPPEFMRGKAGSAENISLGCPLLVLG
jgi:hypothetical protein